MGTLSKNYLSPEIIRVDLDNEISMVLNSAPPEGPGETVMNHTSDQFNQTATMV